MDEEINVPHIRKLKPIPRDFDLPEDWRESIKGLYESGKTDKQVQAWIARNRKCKRFNMHVWKFWLNQYQEFYEVVELGKVFKEDWWLEKGRVNIDNVKFNGGLYVKMMGNMFGWKTEFTDIKSQNAVARYDLKMLSKEDLETQKKLLQKAIKTEDEGHENVYTFNRLPPARTGT